MWEVRDLCSSLSSLGLWRLGWEKQGLSGVKRLRTLVLASGGSHLQVVPLPTQERVPWLSTPWEMEGSLREESEQSGTESQGSCQGPPLGDYSRAGGATCNSGSTGSKADGCWVIRLWSSHQSYQSQPSPANICKTGRDKGALHQRLVRK